MTALIAQVALNTEHNRLDREDRRAARDKAALPKSVREKFQDYTTDRLLILTEAFQDEDLPRIYHELAARQKGVSKRMVLQQAFEIAAGELNLDRLPASPSHVLSLDTWDFTGPTMDTLGAGLLPFSIVPPDAPSKAAQKAIMEDTDRGRQYDLSGEAVAGAISAADAKRLYNAGGYVASEWAEADIQLKLYGIVLGTLLGTTHVVTRGHLSAYRYYERVRTRLQAAMNLQFGARLAPPLLVFHFQLHYRHWFNERFTYGNHTNLPPDVTSGLQQFVTANRLDWLPGYANVPALAALASPTPPGSRVPPTVAAGAPAAASGISSSDRVQNPNRDSRYGGNTPLANNVRSRSIRDALSTAAPLEPPQVTRNGTTIPMCLSWHVKGTCSTGCTRKADHVANSTAEKEALWAWVLPAFS
jgi:hypothetical protein